MSIDDLTDDQAYMETEVLTDLCDIMRDPGLSGVTNEWGGTTSKRELLTAGVPCRIMLYRPKAEVVHADQVKAISTYDGRFAVGTDIRASDQIIMRSGPANGSTLEVANVSPAQTEALLLYVQLEAVPES